MPTIGISTYVTGTVCRRLQDVHGWRLELPVRRADHPDRNLLLQRYNAFSS